MAVAKKILKYLDGKKYRYAVVEHRTTFTAWDTSRTEKVEPKTVAKTLVLRADRDYFLAVLPGNKNLDKQKLLKTANSVRKKAGLKNYKKLELAKEAWMKKNLPGQVGAVPPFAGLLELDVYIDNLLLKNKKIYVGSGEYTASFLINTGEYVKKEEMVRGSFSKKK